MSLTEKELQQIREEAGKAAESKFDGDTETGRMFDFRDGYIAAVTAERERAKVIEEENALLKKRVEELCNDYNELAEQAAVWREESGN